MLVNFLSTRSLFSAIFMAGIFLTGVASDARADSTLLVRAGDDLQAVIDQASPGDTLLLEAGATFTGNFILPLKNTGNKNWITLRTAAADAELPPAGVRVDPSSAHLLPKLVSPNSQAALRAATGAHHYRLVGLEFTVAADVRINFGIVKFGEGNETDTSALPHNMVLDQCYIHGQPLADVARGVALNGGDSTVINSYISECHGIGFDTQAIAGWNGPGPFTIVNNYLEGAGENVMFGGADPKIAGLVPSDIEFRRNHLAKPLSWKEGILSKPSNFSVVGSAAAPGQAGTLVGGVTYYYRVAARARAGQSVTATSAAADEVSVTLQPWENAAQLSWDKVDLATAFRVYRTTDAPTVETRNWVSFDVNAGDCSAETACPILDAGAGDAASAPPTRGTRWSVKNIFELKNARRVVIEGNIFENNWVDGQSGIAILFTVRNQEGSAPWCVVEDVTFTNNIVRHTAGAINILGRDNNHPSEQAKNIRIVNNLFADVNGGAWGGGNGVFLTVTEVDTLVLLNNTVLQSGNIIIAYGKPVRGFKFMNNILTHNDYGIIGDGSGTGNDTLEKYFLDRKVKRNAFIGGKQSLYPGANFFFATINEIGFADPTAGDFGLLPLSPLKALGSNGRDVGCDMNALRAALGL